MRSDRLYRRTQTRNLTFTRGRIIWTDCLLQGVFPIFVGASIYLLWRVSTLRVFDWCEKLGLSDGVDSMRLLAQPLKPILPDWFLFSLPDALWVYAAVVIYRIIWRGAKWTHGVVWICAVSVLAIGSEVGQRIGWVEGTFSLADIAAYCSGAFLAVLHPFRKEET